MSSKILYLLSFTLFTFLNASDSAGSGDETPSSAKITIVSETPAPESPAIDPHQINTQLLTACEKHRQSIALMQQEFTQAKPIVGMLTSALRNLAQEIEGNIQETELLLNTIDDFLNRMIVHTTIEETLNGLEEHLKDPKFADIVDTLNKGSLEGKASTIELTLNFLPALTRKIQENNSKLENYMPVLELLLKNGLIKDALKAADGQG